MAKRTPRAASFLFEPKSFLFDRSVLHMTHAQVGAYIILLCGLWDAEEPGVCDDDDATLAVLSRTGDDWKHYREPLSRAFDTSSRKGRWVQKRMVETHRLQTEFVNRQSRNGKRGAKSKWVKAEDGGAIATLLPLPQRPSNLTSVSGSVSGSVTDEEQPQQLSALTSGAGRKAISRKSLENGEALPEGEITADQAFDEIFWPEYPRKKDREPARKAWKALKLKDSDEEKIRAIMLALRRDIKTEWRDREQDKVPYGATWLNRKGWLDG